jgi:hypothetical protein
VVLGAELLLSGVEDDAVVLLVEGDAVVLLVSWAITGSAQASPRVATAAAWESFFMDSLLGLLMDP